MTFRSLGTFGKQQLSLRSAVVRARRNERSDMTDSAPKLRLHYCALGVEQIGNTVPVVLAADADAEIARLQARVRELEVALVDILEAYNNWPDIDRICRVIELARAALAALAPKEKP